MSLLDLFFPRKCLECSESGRYICDSCLSKVGRGRVDYSNNLYCIFEYKGVIRSSITKLKYNFASSIAEELAHRAIEKCDIPFKLTNPLLIPVPLSKQRENWRGYNQSDILGVRIASSLGWNYASNLLKRTSQGIPQAQLSREKRLRNISGKYAVNRDILKNYKESSIVVFDDVITTGATITECMKSLRKAGFKDIFGMGLCG